MLILELQVEATYANVLHVDVKRSIFNIYRALLNLY